MELILPAPATPLCESFHTFFADCAQHWHSISRVVAKLCARLVDNKTLKPHLAPLPVEARKAVRSWRTWALSSYYVGQLWRALLDQKPDRWGVRHEDVKYVVTRLEPEDRSRLALGWFQARTDRLPATTTENLSKALLRYAKRMAYTKLRFLSRYDTALSQEDLVASLLEVGIYALRRYEHHGNELLALNFAKRSIHNRTIHLIHAHTASKRSRLVSIEYQGQQFVSRVVSLEGMKTVPKVVTEDCGAVLSQIESELGKTMAFYARAVLGQAPAFDVWVRKMISVEPEDLPRQKLESLARVWAGVSRREVTRKLIPLLTGRVAERSIVEQAPRHTLADPRHLAVLGL